MAEKRYLKFLPDDTLASQPAPLNGGGSRGSLKDAIQLMASSRLGKLLALSLACGVRVAVWLILVGMWRYAVPMGLVLAVSLFVVLARRMLARQMAERALSEIFR